MSFSIVSRRRAVVRSFKLAALTVTGVLGASAGAASFGAQAGAAQDATALTARLLADHPALRDADYESAREDWLKALESEPTSPLAYAAASMLHWSDELAVAAFEPSRLHALVERIPDARAARLVRDLEIREINRTRFSSEPTAALDSESGVVVMDLLQELAHEKDRAVIAVTHDNRILHYADRTVHIEDGRIGREEAAMPVVNLSTSGSIGAIQ